jgi:hypothetical protein
MNVSSIYRIKIQGELPESWSERLQGMVITVERSDEEGPVTTLEGPLRDQAALSGVLNTLYDRHFAVLAVERIKKPKGENNRV